MATREKDFHQFERRSSNDEEEHDFGRRSVEALVCEKHGGELIDRYCNGHDVACCSLCALAYHRTCKEITRLPHIANKVHKSSEFKKFTSDLIHLRQTISKLKKTRTDDQTRLRQETHDAAEEIKDFRQQIDWVLDRLERKGKEYIEKRYKEFNKRIVEDITKCEEMIATIEKLQEQFTSIDDNSQLFVKMKNGKFNLQTWQTVCNELKVSSNKAGIVKFSVDPKVEKFARNLGWYGKDRTYLSFDPPPTFPHMYTVKNENEFNIKVKGDKAICSLMDICQLPDGTILVADSANRKVKQLDISYKVVDFCDVQGELTAVCAVNENQAAISLTDKDDTTIQLLTITSKLTPTSCFRLNHRCVSICFKGDVFYISSDTTVNVYSPSGDFIRELYTNKTGLIKNIASNCDGAKVYIAEGERGFVTLDTHGEVLATFDDAKLKGTCGVSLDKNDQVFICGYDSNNVLQLGHDNQKLGYILTHASGLRNTQSICFDTFSNRLIITRKGHNCIKVLSLK